MTKLNLTELVKHIPAGGLVMVLYSDGSGSMSLMDGKIREAMYLQDAGKRKPFGVNDKGSLATALTETLKPIPIFVEETE